MQKKILIIEDDSFLRELLAKKLTANGFKVGQTADGQGALSYLKEQKPDLIILDLLLPKIDGFEVLSKIKNDPQTSSIPILILSNLAHKEEIERGFKLGALDFLIKSQYTPEEIVVKVKEILEKKSE